ncbi:MAG: AMP-binding protein, partial [Candidatus Binatia bacterium]
VEELHLERNLSRNPLFQVTFSLQNSPSVPLELAGVAAKDLEVAPGIARFDLHLLMEEEEAGLRGYMDYNTDLFDAATITRMQSHFQTLLEGIVANPDERIERLPLLTEAERHQRLTEWNGTKRDFRNDKRIQELFEEQVERSPDAVAVVFGNEQLTYGELNRRANQLAHYLQKLGVGPDVLVGICTERSLETVVGMLGILKAGGAYVPIDPDYPKERLAFMLDDTGAQVLLTQSKFLSQLPEMTDDGRPPTTEGKPTAEDRRRTTADDAQSSFSRSTVGGLRSSSPQSAIRHSQSEIRHSQSAFRHPTVICLDKDWELIAHELDTNLSVGASAENLAYVIYTSGSTGKPKGVAIPHKAVNRLVINTDYIDVRSTDIVAQAAN